jgi:hypothetical protein
MHLARTSLAAVAALAALALPAAADAKGNDPAKGAAKQERKAQRGAHGKQRGHKVSLLLRGTYAGGALQVTGGNRATKRAGLVGQSVQLDLAAAQLKVHDRNGDGARDAEDLQDGDRVVVQVRLARGEAADGELAVRKLVARSDSGDDSTATEDDQADGADGQGADDPADDPADDTTDDA